MENSKGRTPPVQDPMAAPPSGRKIEWNLGFLLKTIWRGWHILALGVVVGLIGALIYLSYFTSPAYMASAVIGPAESYGGGQSSALAAYGLDFGEGGGSLSKFQEVMYSVRTAEELQKKYRIMQHIFPGWDEASQSWKPPTRWWPRTTLYIKSLLGLPGWKPPTELLLAQFLRGSVTVNPVVQTDVVRSGLYTVSFIFPDREYALSLLSEVLQETDTLVRQDRLVNTANRIQYLQDLLGRTQELVMRDSLQRLLQQEQQSRMTLQADKFYVVDLIDPPSSDLNPVSPRVNMVMLEGVAGGMALAVLALMAMLWRRTKDPRYADVDPLSVPFPGLFSGFGLFSRRAPAPRAAQSRDG